MLLSLLWACAALDALQAPPVPEPGPLSLLTGEGPTLRVDARTSPSTGLWDPTPLPDHEDLVEQGRLGLVAARVAHDDELHATLRARLPDTPQAWPLLLTDDPARCAALVDAVADAPPAAWRALLLCDPAGYAGRDVPAAARAWLHPDDDPLADVGRTVRGDLGPYALLARHPLHRGALARGYATCVGDADPWWQGRCLVGLAAMDRQAAADALREHPDLADHPVAASLAAWPSAEALADRLDALGFPAPADGPLPGDLVGQLHARGRAVELDAPWGEQLLATLLDRLGLDAAIDSWRPADDRPGPTLALFVHHDGVRHRALLPADTADPHRIAGLANAVAEAAARPDRVALVEHGGSRWALIGPADALDALEATGALRWAAAPPPPPDDTGLP